MRTTERAIPADATPGFAIKLNDDTDLGIAMLILEDEEGAYEPVGTPATINEARVPKPLSWFLKDPSAGNPSRLMTDASSAPNGIGKDSLRQAPGQPCAPCRLAVDN